MFTCRNYFICMLMRTLHLHAMRTRRSSCPAPPQEDWREQCNFGQSITCYISKWRNIWIRDGVFFQHFWCWRQNISGIQHTGKKLNPI